MKALGCGGQVAEVCYAKVQGQQACIDHFKNAKFPVLDLDCLPIEFRHMVRLQHLLCLQHFATLATMALYKLQHLYRHWLWQPSDALMPSDPRWGCAGVGGDGRGARLAAPAGCRLSTPGKKLPPVLPLRQRAPWGRASREGAAGEHGARDGAGSVRVALSRQTLRPLARRSPIANKAWYGTLSASGGRAARRRWGRTAAGGPFMRAPPWQG